jgi:hypothetical protein
MKNFGFRTLSFFQFFLFVLFVLIVLFLDLMDGFSLYSNNKYILYCVISVVLTLIPWFLSKERKFLIRSVVYLLVLLVLPFTDFVPTKPLTRAMHKFDKSMDIDKIPQLVEEEFSKTKFNKPTLRVIDDSTQQFILDPTDADYDSHWLIVHYKNKLFYSAEIIPD